MCLQSKYIQYMYKQDLVLNNHYSWYTMKPNQTKLNQVSRTFYSNLVDVKSSLDGLESSADL